LSAIVTIKKKTKFLNVNAVIADIALDSSYPTGGEAISASQFGLNSIDFVMPSFSAGYDAEYDHANKKLKMFTAGSEVTDTTDLSAVTVRVLAIGL
jgi:hypothetical protein